MPLAHAARSTAAVTERDDPEREALAALDEGERERALTVLMSAYGAPVYRYCRRMTGDADLAADAQQTTFVQAYEALPRFGRRSTLRTWLFGIARHRCLDAVKARRRRERRFESRAELPDAPATGADPEEALVGRSFAKALEGCLQELAPAARTAVLLRYQEGFSYAEMVRICRDRAETLRVRVSRALPVLRACLQSRGVDG